MGKFDGVLLVSDYDDTLYNSKHEVSDENRRAIEYFMGEGGRFTIATGRAYETFTPQIAREGLKFNAPVILSNGSAIYDYEKGSFLHQSHLGEEAPAHMAHIMERFPMLGFEAYHEGDIFVLNPNDVSYEHLRRVNVPYTLCGRVEEMPAPWTKLILEQDHPVLLEIQKVFREEWSHLYEAIFSNHYLLEITALGNNKGALVKMLADWLGIGKDHVYCMGDNQNDIPMLAASAIGFAPANCAQEVKDWGARPVCHCDDHAVAQVIGILDQMY